MALPSTIYRASIQLSDLDRQVYEQLQTTIARHPSETEERLVVRLLAYLLCYQEGLVFTKGVGAGDEPDLWVIGPDGRPTLWVEVGLPDPERLVKASRHVGCTVLFSFGRNLAQWLAQHQTKLAGCRNLTVLAIDAQFLASMVGTLERMISWEVTVTEGTLYLTVGGETLETSPALVVGSAL
ncbi:hypothetical protein GMLC_34100 [Geomonas limicola]|uniref:YaeQ family protein n=1 Tax=Geomonas limicola TaxID=2740186 RepID=A0A6V8NBE4_9BACT|nr:YaeQ family protein [Geomonas limicola]GFO69831.1 hypothetical protein GMLC_34100 [Geomonas limicola]